MSDTRVCTKCSNPAAPGALTCTAHTEEDFDAFLKDPFGGKADVIPSEDVEKFARMLREQYVALRRQHFTETQAISIVSQVVATIVGKAWDTDSETNDGGE